MRKPERRATFLARRPQEKVRLLSNHRAPSLASVGVCQNDEVFASLRAVSSRQQQEKLALACTKDGRSLATTPVQCFPSLPPAFLRNNDIPSSLRLPPTAPQLLRCFQVGVRTEDAQVSVMHRTSGHSGALHFRSLSRRLVFVVCACVWTAF